MGPIILVAAGGERGNRSLLYLKVKTCKSKGSAFTCCLQGLYKSGNFKVWAKVAAFKWHCRFLTQIPQQVLGCTKGSPSQCKVSEQPMSVGKGPAGVESWRPAGL